MLSILCLAIMWMCLCLCLCYWLQEIGWIGLLQDSLHSPHSSTQVLPSLTPFDSLLLPYVTDSDRLALAVKASDSIVKSVLQPGDTKKMQCLQAPVVDEP